MYNTRRVTVRIALYSLNLRNKGVKEKRECGELAVGLCYFGHAVSVYVESSVESLPPHCVFRPGHFVAHP
jgi:hypothetical protein